MKLLNTLNSRENIDQSNEKHSSVFRDVLLFMSYSPVISRLQPKDRKNKNFLAAKIFQFTDVNITSRNIINRDVDFVDKAAD